MNEQSKLYVFEKKEVLLIFVFMLLIAGTSFLIGVKVGSTFSFEESGYKESDHPRSIEIQSQEEERVSEIIADENEEADPGDMSKFKKETEKNLSKKLEQEFATENKKFNKDSHDFNKKNEADLERSLEVQKKAYLNVAAPEVKVPKADGLSGRYTIQIGSYRSVPEAEEFSDAYKVRGYNPIINEVTIKERGTWYRVSLGVFTNLTEAKEYIVENKTLFAGGEYVIVQFD